MNVSVDLAREEQKPVVHQLLQLYLHDFSEFAGFDLNEHGFYSYRWLDFYWVEDERSPFLVTVDGKLAGFVFVRREDRPTGPCHHIAEFFIMRKYRRSGVGETVARAVFQRFPGSWTFHIDLRNGAAIPFWRKVVGRLTDGQFTERSGDSEHRIVLDFEVPVPSPEI